MLPGHRLHAAIEGRRRFSFRLSSVACGILLMLVGATALFAMAHVLADANWAVAVCSNAGSFCEHPEWTGAAGIAMLIVFLTRQGMED